MIKYPVHRVAPPGGPPLATTMQPRSRRDRNSGDPADQREQRVEAGRFGYAPLLLGMALLVVLVFAITIARVPTPSADSSFYASIARSIQMNGSGVPSMIWTSPYAVDHLPFYGPVFFKAAATSLRVFGVTAWSTRIVSLLGALLLALGGAMLAHYLNPHSDRGLWSFTLLLMTPEFAGTATDGTMHTTAVAFEILALATFVRGLMQERAPLSHGATAGFLLALASLTTPRTYPFVVAFMVAGAVLPGMPVAFRRRAYTQLAAAVGVFVIGIGLWATMSHGNPFRWARYMTFILTHEDADVAILPSATRVWAVSWSAPVTVMFAVVGVAVAAAAIARSRDDRNQTQRNVGSFVVLTGWITFVLSVTVMNIAAVFRPYSVLPLFAAVLAIPFEALNVKPRTIAVGVTCLVLCDLSVSVVRYTLVAATWSARDPAPLEAFFKNHVPAGSAVIGPVDFYFTAVERSGARYLSMDAESYGTWARWVPVIEPEARAALPWKAAEGRYLVWPDENLPDEYACAIRHIVAVYQPAPGYLKLLGPLIRAMANDVGFPKTLLYQLPPGCPTGYDPTHLAPEASR
jgi:hypothetical protein